MASPKINADVLANLGLKNLLMPLLMVLGAVLFGVTGAAREQVIITGATPTAVAAAIFALKNNTYTANATATILISTILGIGTAGSTDRQILFELRATAPRFWDIHPNRGLARRDRGPASRRGAALPLPLEFRGVGGETARVSGSVEALAPAAAPSRASHRARSGWAEATSWVPDVLTRTLLSPGTGGLPTSSQGHCGAVTPQGGGAPSPLFWSVPPCSFRQPRKGAVLRSAAPPSG